MAQRTKRPQKKSLIPSKNPHPSLHHGWIRPMLAKMGEGPFDDPDWIFEIKWDGYRAIAELQKEHVLLYSRNGNSFLKAYPEIAGALATLGLNAVLDGEVVVTDENGKPDFQSLQYYESNPIPGLKYYVFDLLYFKGKSLLELPLLERKELLRKILPKNNIVRYSDHVSTYGQKFFKISREQDLEGIMAKKADSLYYPGKRTNYWLKIKNHKTTEAIIAGFTEPAGSRTHFGALLLGVIDKGVLRYIGHTGTGFNEATLRSMSAKLKPLIRKTSPFNEKVVPNMPVTWVKPELVCEIKYSEQTREGILRHPVFLQLRPDKKPKEVTLQAMKENPIPPKEKKAKPETSRKPAPEKNLPKIKEGGSDILVLDKNQVEISHPGKIFWPKEKISKMDVVRYYQDMSSVLLPYLKDRPESLKRNPNGILDKGFYHKDAGGDAPSFVKTQLLFSESAGKEIDYIICNNKATLAYLNNLGCIELNPWHSRLNKLDNPDYLVIDLDPSEKNTFDQVIETALAVHEIFEQAGAENFCKTSGATGLHIYVPMGQRYTYDQVKDFAQLICSLTHKLVPDFTSLERNLAKRGTKHIYLDHLQNRCGQTIACAYSLRPYPGANASAPLEWKEVKKGLTPYAFNIQTMPLRLRKKGDLFGGILGKGIDLKKCLNRLEKNSKD